MDSLTSKSKIQPFWNRIPNFFLYAFGTEPLIVVLVTVVASFLLGGGLLNLVLAAVVLKYSMEVLQHTAQGYLSPPKLTYEVLGENLELPFKLGFILIGWSLFLGAVAANAGPLFALGLYTVGNLMWPAVVIALVMSKSLSYAINPANAWAITRQIGWPYLGMFGFLFAFGLAQNTVEHYVLDGITADLFPPLWFGIQAMFGIIIFHLMGYVILQYHEELGGEKPKALQNEEGNRDITSPLLERFIAEGNTAAATEEFASLIKDNPQDMSLRRRMYVYLASTGQQERLGKYSLQYFAALMDAGAVGEATKLYLDSAQRGQPFTPTRPEDYVPLMRELRRRRLGKEAAKLANGFHNRFQNDRHIPEVYLEMARTLCEDMQRDDLAIKTLKFIILRFPDDALIPEVKSYLGLLEQLAPDRKASKKSAAQAQPAQPASRPQVLTNRRA